MALTLLSGVSAADWQLVGSNVGKKSNLGEGCRVRLILPLKRNEECVAAPDSNLASNTSA